LFGIQAVAIVVNVYRDLTEDATPSIELGALASLPKLSSSLTWW